jgi:hypothetical protein
MADAWAFHKHISKLGYGTAPQRADKRSAARRDRRVDLVPRVANVGAVTIPGARVVGEHHVRSRFRHAKEFIASSRKTP